MDTQNTTFTRTFALEQELDMLREARVLTGGRRS
jgi:hypothetical protein